MTERKAQRGARYSAFISKNKKSAEIVDLCLKDSLEDLGIADLLELGSTAYDLSHNNVQKQHTGRFKVAKGEVLPEIMDLEKRGGILMALRPRDLRELVMLSERAIGNMQ